MRFVIKNYIKTSRGEKLYATFTDIVKDVSEAKEKIAELIELVRSVDSRMKGAGRVVKLLEMLSEINKKIEHDVLIIKVLPNDMKKEESKADCVAKISWHLDTKKETEIDFEQSVCDISGLYFSDPQEDWGLYFSFKKEAYNINKIPLNEFEKYAKEIPDSWFDENAGINTNRYGCGGILIVNGKEYIIRKSGNEKDAIKLKNVAGEIFGAITVMKAARKLRLKRIKLYFDFSGIEDIALGKIQPKQKNRFLLSYREFFTEINKYIKIDFCKVKSHSGIELNNRADRLAKQAVGLRREV